MKSTAFSVGVLFLASVVTAQPASAADAVGGAVLTRHPVLAASLTRLAGQSPSWREAMAVIAGLGRRTLVVTADKVRIPDGKGNYRRFDPEVLAEAQPLPDAQSRVDTVVVIVNLDLLQRISGLPVESADFEDDLDRILAHEIFGHAVPYLLAGSMAGRCADPEQGQRATDACAIKRENVIRKELRLGLRLDSGHDSLAIARRYWNH